MRMQTALIAATVGLAAGTGVAQVRSLTTTFAAGNGHNGAMFDLTVKNPAGIRIVGFDYNERSGGPGSVVEVYYVTDLSSYVGKELDPGAWTLMGTETVPLPAPTGSPTHVDIGGLEIDGGRENVGIYFTITSGSISYTNGPLGAFENDDLRFEDRGAGIVYPWSSIFQPRIWNGTIYYELLDGGCYADCDESGDLDFFDFLCFQNAFAAGEPYADCDGSGSLDFFDFLCFQNEFAAGCP
jgi:hypothetical protein